MPLALPVLLEDRVWSLFRSSRCCGVLRDDRGNNPNPLINGNCCELGTGPMVAVGCELLLLPIAVAAAWERFWACAAIACAAAARNSIKHVVGVKSLKSQGCSSEGGEIWPSFDLKSERKTEKSLIFMRRKLQMNKTRCNGDFVRCRAFGSHRILLKHRQKVCEWMWMRT